MKTIATDKHSVVVGLGKTGLSCARYLSSLGHRVTVVDSRQEPPGKEMLRSELPDVSLIAGGFDTDIFKSADQLIVNPGVPLSTPEIQEAIAAGVRVRGDIDVFAEVANAPIVAITGSNGKSTVTSLVGEMARLSGVEVQVGGNLGEPALNLLAPNAKLYVLELSSFQLETTEKLNAKCAVILNISEDHMDRYDTRMEYLQAKQRIFRGAKHVVVNDDDALSQPLVTVDMKLSHFGLANPDLNKVSVVETEDGRFLVKGFDPVLPVEELSLDGEHNLSNALAAIAIGLVVDLDIDAMKSVLRTFKGLPHRCQFVRKINDIAYINDSKGTNVGATSAAIDGFSTSGKRNIILIAGGDSKEADLAPLEESMSKAGYKAILIGKDASAIEQVLAPVVDVLHAKTMKEAVNTAQSVGRPGDIVLLSPACASFDMFENYLARGNAFVEEVNAL